jgi:hypothetical protein
MVEGTLLAESLRVGSQVRVPGLRLTLVVRQDVSAWEPGARPAVRTFLEFEAADEVADELARSLAASLLPEGGWYADFAVGDDHVVVFAGKIFRYRRGDHAGRAEAVEYARRAGVADPAEHLGADRFMGKSATTTGRLDPVTQVAEGSPWIPDTSGDGRHHNTGGRGPETRPI